MAPRNGLGNENKVLMPRSDASIQITAWKYLDH